jgi:calcineurin-like phosphoesterase
MDDIAAFLDTPDSKQLRPDNIMGEDISGTGHREFTFGGKKILVINLLGTIFMGDILAT